MKIAPAADHGADALAACFSASFEGYIAGSMAMDAAGLPRFLARQGADLGLSRCVLDDGGELLGLCFVGAFDDRRRIGGMGLLPRARGSGAAGLLMQHVIAEARSAACSALELEVFAQNTPAVRLYRSFGFVELAPLWGFTGAAGAAIDAPSLVPRSVSPTDAADWLQAHGPADLPYQVSAHALRRADPAATLWRAGSALAMFSAAADRQLLLGLLFDAEPQQHDARALLAAIVAAHPQHSVRVPQLMRDDVAGRALRDAGFAPLALHQLQMRLRCGA